MHYTVIHVSRLSLLRLGEREPRNEIDGVATIVLRHASRAKSKLITRYLLFRRSIKRRVSTGRSKILSTIARFWISSRERQVSFH